jgi:hypothetical protein
MTESEIAGLITLGAGGVAAFARWALRLWATVRREGIASAKENSAAQRADNERMIEALVEQARSNAALAAAHADLATSVERLSQRLDRLEVRGTYDEWAERTPTERLRDRQVRTANDKKR